MKVFYVDTDKAQTEYAWANAGNSIFLAGPTPRRDDVPSWRVEALRLLEEMSFTGDVFVPEDKGANRYADYNGQINWEWKGLDAAKVIVFWVPRTLETLPGFTTNVEFGYYANSGRVVLGYPEGAPKMRYLHAMADKCEIPTAHSLEQTLRLAIARL